ncbi:hypothetical protein BDZ97DRAFT_1914175 [Flammula alnicola]|nr:hypothetical protein BDZ97DRAFT_1914175 [Flammula alnicola]
MPRFVQVLKDTCPPLVFSTGWNGGFSETDAALDQYSQATYTVTQTPGATMDFQFNGTYIGIYGAKRPDHGLYKVTVDGHVFPTFNANSNVALFNQTLFNSTLQDGYHKVTLTNVGNTTLDVDYISFEGNIGKQSEPLVITTFQDNDPAFTYFPRSSWQQTSRPGTFSGSTGTVTTDPSATVEYKFQGISDLILLYGLVTPASTPAYLASVDGGPFRQFSAQKASSRPHQVLYYASNLGRGTHTLRIKFLPTNGTMGQFAVDFANLYSVPSLGAQSPKSFDVQAPLTIGSPSQTVPPAFIAGLTISSVLAFLGLLSSLYLLWCLRRQRSEKRFSASQKYIDADE